MVRYTGSGQQGTQPSSSPRPAPQSTGGTPAPSAQSTNINAPGYTITNKPTTPQQVQQDRSGSSAPINNTVSPTNPVKYGSKEAYEASRKGLATNTLPGQNKPTLSSFATEKITRQYSNTNPANPYSSLQEKADLATAKKIGGNIDNVKANLQQVRFSGQRPSSLAVQNSLAQQRAAQIAQTSPTISRTQGKNDTLQRTSINVPTKSAQPSSSVLQSKVSNLPINSLARANAQQQFYSFQELGGTSIPQVVSNTKITKNNNNQNKQNIGSSLAPTTRSNMLTFTDITNQTSKNIEGQSHMNNNASGVYKALGGSVLTLFPGASQISYSIKSKQALESASKSLSEKKQVAEQQGKSIEAFTLGFSSEAAKIGAGTIKVGLYGLGIVGAVAVGTEVLGASGALAAGSAAVSGIVSTPIGSAVSQVLPDVFRGNIVSEYQKKGGGAGALGEATAEALAVETPNILLGKGIKIESFKIPTLSEGGVASTRTAARTLVLDVGQIGPKNIIGVGDYGLRFGTQPVNLANADLAQGLTVATKSQKAIFQASLPKITTSAEIEKFNLGTSIAERTQGIKSAFIADRFPTQTQSLNTQATKAVVSTAKELNAELFGSFPAQSQLPQELKRIPGDIDVKTSLTQEKAIEVAQKLAKKIRLSGEVVRINPETPTLIETKRGGQFVHAVDVKSIEGNVEVGSTSVQSDTIYGLNLNQKPIKIQDVLTQPLSEQGVRKTSSIFTLTKEGEQIKFAPKPHRYKDVADYFTTQEALGRSAPLDQQRKILSDIEELKTFYPKNQLQGGELKVELFKKAPLSEGVSPSRVISQSIPSSSIVLSGSTFKTTSLRSNALANSPSISGSYSGSSISLTPIISPLPVSSSLKNKSPSPSIYTSLTNPSISPQLSSLSYPSSSPSLSLSSSISPSPSPSPNIIPISLSPSLTPSLPPIFPRFGFNEPGSKPYNTGRGIVSNRYNPSLAGIEVYLSTGRGVRLSKGARLPGTLRNPNAIFRPVVLRPVTTKPVRTQNAYGQSIISQSASKKRLNTIKSRNNLITQNMGMI